MAYQSGLGEYTMRQQQQAQQAQLAYDQMANQQAMQANQIAAQQQSQMFQHQAGLQDAYQRAMLGEGMAQNQFGRQMFADQVNFGQQTAFADYQTQLQDRSWENRLNAEGRAKLAESNRQRDLIEGYDFASPQQKQEAMAQWTASQAGLKDPRFFMPEPPPMDEWAKSNILDLPDKGIMVLKQDDGKYTVTQSRKAAIEEADRTRKEMLQAELENKLEVAKQQRKNAEIDFQQKQFESDDKRRDTIITNLMSRYQAEKKIGANDVEIPAYSADEALAKAQEEARRIVPDRRAARQEFEQDYDEYREFIETNRVGGMGTADDAGLPEDFSQLPFRKQREIREEVQAWKGEITARQPRPQQQTSPFGSQVQQWQPSRPEEEYAAEWNSTRPTQPWQNLQPEEKVIAAQMLDQQGGQRQQQAQQPPPRQQFESAAKALPIADTKEEYDRLVASRDIEPGKQYIRDGIIYTAK